MTRLPQAALKKLGVKQNKYGNSKVEVDGHLFDSKREAHYYRDLKLLQRAGEVAEIELQPVFEVLKGFTHKGKKYRSMSYRADFRVTYADGRIEVIDCKGYPTPEYKLKKKLFLSQNPNVIFREV